MLQYVGLRWDFEDPQAAQRASQLLGRLRARSSRWRSSYDAPGCIVVSTGDAPVRIGAHGVVLGQLFRASQPATRSVDLDEYEAARIANSGGRALVREFWGNYVAFLVDAPTMTCRVLRGPCATLPCLHTLTEGVEVYFSWMETIAELLPQHFSIDWQQLVRSLVGPLMSERTGLNEVRELLPGFCEEIQGTRRRQHCYWNPIAVAQQEPVRNFDLAVTTLRNVVISTAHAWASRSPSILHGLSGGLDSSIVLSALSTAPSIPTITCLNHFADSMADERPYARLVANHLNCPLVELRRTADVDLRGALHGLRLDSTPGMRVRDIERLELDAARESDATFITKGWGGDELFCRHHEFFHAADLLRDRWLSSELLDQVAYSAMLEGETLWTMLARIFRDAFGNSRWNLTKVFRDEQSGQSLLNSDIERAAESTTEFDPPWASDTGRCGPGKLWQVSLITARRPHYNPWARDGDAQVISPLLSQPIVETCLRIPTYLQMQNRGERAVARAAFAPMLPAEVIARRSKGVADGLAWKTFRANLRFVRELLLDGELIRQGLVNRTRLERALADELTSTIRSTVPVFDLVGAEAWLRPWLRDHSEPASLRRSRGT